MEGFWKDANRFKKKKKQEQPQGLKMALGKKIVQKKEFPLKWNLCFCAPEERGYQNVFCI